MPRIPVCIRPVIGVMFEEHSCLPFKTERIRFPLVEKRKFRMQETEEKCKGARERGEL